MTTKAQVRKLLKPLVDEYPDLDIAGRYLVVKPVHHVFRGVIFKFTSDANWFQPFWFVTFLCAPLDHFEEAWGERIFLGGRRCLWSDKLVPETMRQVLSDRILPSVRPIDSLQKMVAWLNSWAPAAIEYNPLRSLPLHIALGDLDAARRFLDRIEPGRERWSHSSPRTAERLRTPLKPLLASGDREGLARQLHDWEAMHARMLGLEGIWQPSPFPIEMATSSQ